MKEISNNNKFINNEHEMKEISNNNKFINNEHEMKEISNNNKFINNEHEMKEISNNKFINNEVWKNSNELNSNIFFVGDDDQCIYTWRGANIDNILQLHTIFENLNIYKLECNYRCTQEILDLANYVISYNKQRMGKKLYSDRKGEKSIVCATGNEGEFIAKEIKNLISIYNDCSIAILVRATSLISSIEKELIGLPYIIIGAQRLQERPAIRTLLSYLRVIFRKDTLALEYMINTPKRGIGEKKFEKILELLQTNNNNLKSVLVHIGLIELAEQITIWETMGYEIINELISYLSGIFSQEDFQEFLLHSKKFKTIDELLNNFVFTDKQENVQIKIMTIHMAKGLEFDYVFIPGLVQNMFPNIRSIKEGNIEEERRLFYVAITRARKKLFMSYSLKGFQIQPSLFLYHLPQSLVTYKIY